MSDPSQPPDDFVGAFDTAAAGDKFARSSKEAAPGVPTSKQGDNSIQTWGLEASRAEREEATSLVQAYLDARAARDWRTACSFLVAKSRAEQGRIAGGASCAKGMALFASDASSAVLAEEAEIHVLSFRVGGGYAFLIYRRPDGIFAMGLAREAGAWSVISVTAQGFNPRGAQATPYFEGGGTVTAFAKVGGTLDCPAPAVEVQTFENGSRTKQPFYVALYR